MEEVKGLFDAYQSEGVKALLDREVTLRGWIRTVRSSGEIGFLQLHDGTCFKPVQIVFDSKLSNFAEVEKFHVGSAIEITGKVVESPGDKQPFEIKASAVSLLSDCGEDYPLQKKGHTMEFMRTIAHLRPRSNTFQAVFRLRSVLAHAIHSFFQDQGFVHVHTPILTANDAEGAGEMFTVGTHGKDKQDQFDLDFFGDRAGLTVSGQLNAEAFALAFNKVYTFGPTFRAENSNTARHAAEFWMIEPEIAFADLADDMDLAENMMKYCFKEALEKCGDEMQFFEQRIQKGVIERLESILKADFERLPYTEAIKMLEGSSEKFEFPVSWGIDLQSEHEQWICEQLGKPVFITDYPKDIKAFYMRLNDDEKTVAATDLLVPGVGEIIGGSQREERLDVLDQRIQDIGIDPEHLWWYRELRKYGGVEHAGFGLGFERLIQYVSGMHNIRDVIAFPRTPRNCEF